MVSMSEFLKKDLLIILVLLLTSPLFFYKLGQSSLTSWDEAWYAEIAKNILSSGDLFNMTWNGLPYFDHPPAGFWLMATSYAIFGINEFSARFPQALAGLISIIILYFLGKELFSKLVGFASALALISAPWFLFRARSGNLDVLLTLGFLLSILFALKAAKNPKVFSIPFALSLTLLFLTKTFVPLTIIPVLLIIFWKTKFIKSRKFILSLVIFLLLVSIWFVIQFVNQPDFLTKAFRIGLPEVTVNTSFRDNLSLIKGYLHSGVGKWFWPGIVSMFISIFLFLKYKQKRFLILPIFFITFFLPFLFSTKGHIWHLIPLHPIVILSFFGTSFLILEKKFSNKLLIAFLILMISFYFSFIQIKRSLYEFIDVQRYISDEAILSKEAGKFSEDFFISDEFLPTAVFYSGKKVYKLKKDEQLSDLFNSNDKFILITYQWYLDKVGIPKSKYKVIKKDRDKILVQRTLKL